MTLKGRSSKRSTNIFSIVSMMAFMAVWLSACGDFFGEDEIHYPVCEPPPDVVNIYKPTPIPTLSTVTQPFPLPVFTPPAPISKEITLHDLMEHVERWTDMTIIPVDEDSYVRMALTFLSPELLRTTSILDNIGNYSNDSDINNKAAKELQEISESERLLFFLAVFPIDSGSKDETQHSVQFNAGGLTLINANGLQVKPASYEHDLDQQFTPDQIVSGYLYYPISVDVGNECVEVLDTKFDKKLIFQLPKIFIDKASTGPYSWMIQYTYLLNSENIHHNQDGWVPPIDEEIRAKDSPPTGAEINDNFWKEYAEFIWGKTTP